MKKGAKGIVVFLLLFLLIAFFVTLGGVHMPWQLIPGPEGPTCSVYAVEACDGLQHAGDSVELDQNLGVKSVIGKVYPGTWIAWKKSGDDTFGYQWGSPDPHNPVIFAGKVMRNARSGVNLEVRIRKPTVQDVDIHGNPAGRSPSKIEYYVYEASKTQSGNQISWKHYECYIVPVDFVIELSVRGDSGERWGAFKEFYLWFVLDTVEWLNAFSKQMHLQSPPPENVSITSYNYRGAFPIWAWVGTWDPFVYKNQNGEEWRASEIPWEEVDEYVQVWPSYKGSEITLYKEPEWIYDRVFAEDIIRNPETLKNVLGGQIGSLPDPRFAQTVYFYLDLVKFGALKKWGWSPFWPFGYWENYYYPTAYLRVRALYAVWGEWIYLWTQEEAERTGYEWENRTSVVERHPSAWDSFWGGVASWFGGVGQWLSNPFNQLWIFFILIVIVIIIVSVFSPGVWTVLASRKSSGT